MVVTGIDLQLQMQSIEMFSITPQVQKVFLFASRARGDADSRSDIDLAIIAPEATQRQWLEILDHIDQLDTLLKFDITRFESASKELQEIVNEEGVILYARS